MRISDWSSDVCSSDLAIGPAKDIVVVGGGNSELDAYVEKLAKMTDRTVKAEPTPEKGFYYRSDHFSFAKLGVPMFNFGSGDELVEGGRSEEHTSEIQSLMRISYAVF